MNDLVVGVEVGVRIGAHERGRVGVEVDLDVGGRAELARGQVVRRLDLGVEALVDLHGDLGPARRRGPEPDDAAGRGAGEGARLGARHHHWVDGAVEGRAHRVGRAPRRRPDQRQQRQHGQRPHRHGSPHPPHLDH